MRNLERLVLAGMVCCTVAAASLEVHAAGPIASFNESVEGKAPDKELGAKQIVVLKAIDRISTHYNELAQKIGNLGDFFVENNANVERKYTIETGRQFIAVGAALAKAKRTIVDSLLTIATWLPYSLAEIVSLIGDNKENLKNKNEKIRKMAEKNVNNLADLARRTAEGAKAAFEKAQLSFSVPQNEQSKHLEESLSDSIIFLMMSMEEAFSKTNVEELVKERVDSIYKSARSIWREFKSIEGLYYEFVTNKVDTALKALFLPKLAPQE
jgi:hypothetical protein